MRRRLSNMNITYSIFILYTIWYSIWYIVNWNIPKRTTSFLQMNILWWLTVRRLYGLVASRTKEPPSIRKIQLIKMN